MSLYNENGRVSQTRDGAERFDIGLIIGPSEFEALLRIASQGNTDAHKALGAIGGWLKRFATIAPKKRPLCINCDQEFCHGTELPFGFAVVIPWGESGQTVCSGICRRCWNENTDLLAIALREWKAMCPGLRVVQGGQA